MEGEKFSWFAKNYCLRKRPRLSPTSLIDEQMASTSTCMPSTSSSISRRVRTQRILIEPTDEQLLKWQERQISDCIVENTVNQMVESYLTFIEGENANHSSVARNEVDREAHIASYHAYRAQENFEDSAIMWAIDRHGLQQHSQFLSDNPTETMSTSSSSISLSSPPHQVQDDFFVCSNQNTERVKNTQAESNSRERQLNSTDENGDVGLNQKTPAQKAENCFNDGTSTQSPQYDGEPAISDEHFDFMEAAVAVAIQEKGLSSYSMQQSPNR